jgi:hypothetical protein
MGHAGGGVIVVIDVTASSDEVRSIRAVQQLKASTSSNTCTMVMQQDGRICNILKLTRQNRRGNWRRYMWFGYGKRCKGKRVFIKDNIARDVYTVRRNMETLVSFMKGTVAKKHTFFRPKL